MTPPKRSSNSGTLLALAALMVPAVGLLALTAMIMPKAFGFLLVVLGLFLFVGLHYLVWGWWLGKRPLGGDEPTDDRRSSPGAADADEDR